MDFRKNLRFLLATFRRPSAIMASVLLIGVFVSDFYISFWNLHAMITNLTSSALIAIIGFAVINEWLSRAEEQRWARIGNICLKSLAQTVTLARDGLIYIANGALPFPEEYQSNPFPQSVMRYVRKVSKRPLRCSGHHDIDDLMHNENWVRAAYATLRIVSKTEREAIAIWAPIMIGSDRLSSALSFVGHLADAVEDLHRPFGVIHRSKSGIAQESRRRKTAELIDLTLTFSVALEEWLTATMGRQNWKTRGRELLSSTGIEMMTAMDAGVESIITLEGHLAVCRNELRRLYVSAYETAANINVQAPTA